MTMIIWTFLFLLCFGMAEEQSLPRSDANLLNRALRDDPDSLAWQTSGNLSSLTIPASSLQSLELRASSISKLTVNQSLRHKRRKPDSGNSVEAKRSQTGQRQGSQFQITKVPEPDRSASKKRQDSNLFPESLRTGLSIIAGSSQPQAVEVLTAPQSLQGPTSLQAQEVPTFPVLNDEIVADIPAPILESVSRLPLSANNVHLPFDSSLLHNDSAIQFGEDYFLDFNGDEEGTSTPLSLHDLSMLSNLDALVPDEDVHQEKASASADENRAESCKKIPLYKGAAINQWESLTSILSFVQSEHLSGSGLGRLLSLIDLHLPSPNNFLKTSARIFSVLDTFQEPVKIHYFCSICYKFRKGPADMCDCATNDESKCVLFFITFPLKPQLEKMLQRPGFLEDLKYRQTRSKTNPENIEDIFDGEVYKDAQQFFTDLFLYITFTWNTDGMQIFNSTPFSLWPFYLVINELSPTKRFLSENLLLGGLWGCTVKPHPNVFLLPIYEELQALQEGIDIKCHENGQESTKRVVAKVICGSCDAPATSTFMNMKQHSGFYSCPVCLIKGEKPGDATVFPYEEENVLRTVPEYEDHVKWAVQNKVILSKTPRNEEKWCGVKGPTVLSNMVPNIFSCTAIDAMHCVYLGVMRQMLHLWSDKENKGQPFSIFLRLNIVNERLRKLTPPHFIQRSPQSLEKLIYWKATELRSFLFNLSLIVLIGVLPLDYYNHWALFVKGIALLNSSSVSEEDLVLSSLLLNHFLSQFADLYGVENMSHNLHMTSHLERFVRLLGPLWCVSCFKFEDINGRLSNLIHGTRHAGLQIHKNLSMITQLPIMVQNLQDSPCKEFCLNVHAKKFKLSIKEKISSGLYSVGNLTCFTDRQSWALDILRNQGFLTGTESIKIFLRLLKGKMLFVSNSYNRGTRVSSFVKYMQSNCVRYGYIDFFVKVGSGKDSKYYAIIRRKVVSPLIIQGLEISHILQHTCSNACNDNANSDVINVSDLTSVMYFVKGTDMTYFCEPLNNFELD